MSFVNNLQCKCKINIFFSFLSLVGRKNTVFEVLYFFIFLKVSSVTTNFCAKISLARFVNQTYIVSDFTSGASHSDLRQTLLLQTPQVSGYKFNTAQALSFVANQMFDSSNGVLDNGADRVSTFVFCFAFYESALML